MSPFRPCLNRLSRLPILYQNRRLCHQNPSKQHNADLETERRVLPKELMRNVVRLTCKSTAEPGVCDVYVVGTCHYYQDSMRDVKAIVRFLKPQVIFLELCSSRATILDDKAGSEMGIAYGEASKYGGKVVLGDRPIEVTQKRLWRNLPLWFITLSLLVYMGYFLLPSARKAKLMKKYYDRDTHSHGIQEPIKAFRTLDEILTHERDRYMSCSLLKVAKEHNLVVAVVGKGHLQGIKKNWGQPVSLEELLEVPKRKPGVASMKIISGVAVVGLAIIAGR